MYLILRLLLRRFQHFYFRTVFIFCHRLVGLGGGGGGSLKDPRSTDSSQKGLILHSVSRG